MNDPTTSQPPARPDQDHRGAAAPRSGWRYHPSSSARQLIARADRCAAGHRCAEKRSVHQTGPVLIAWRCLEDRLKAVRHLKESSQPGGCPEARKSIGFDATRRRWTASRPATSSFSRHAASAGSLQLRHLSRPEHVHGKARHGGWATTKRCSSWPRKHEAKAESRRRLMSALLARGNSTTHQTGTDGTSPLARLSHVGPTGSAFTAQAERERTALPDPQFPRLPLGQRGPTANFLIHNIDECCWMKTPA